MLHLISKKTILPTLFMIFCAGACQQRESAPRAQAAQESVAAEGKPAPPAAEETVPVAKDALNPFGTAVAAVSGVDSLRKFVRTADLKFRVREVLPATLQIEDIALRNHGFVTRSNVRTEVEYRQARPVGRDSAVETTRFSVHGQLTLRVPFTLLDTTLRVMGRLVDFMDYRNVSAEDVALRLLEEHLLQLRQSAYQQAINLAGQAGKPANQLDAAERTLNSRTAADQSRIERLKMEDAIQFSTVTIEIYQPAQVRQQMIANTEFRPAEPGFWVRVGDGLRSGAELVQLLVIGLAHLWSLILAALVLYFGVYKRRRDAK